eukprot:scaffold223513_cov16-Tisochrysis_lutea.AAC.1
MVSGIHATHIIGGMAGMAHKGADELDFHCFILVNQRPDILVGQALSRCNSCKSGNAATVVVTLMLPYVRVVDEWALQVECMCFCAPALTSEEFGMRNVLPQMDGSRLMTATIYAGLFFPPLYGEHGGPFANLADGPKAAPIS